MNYIQRTAKYLLACLILAALLPLGGWASEQVPETYTPPHPSTYAPSFEKLWGEKHQYDDPRPYLKTFGMKQILPPDLYEKLTYDIEEMKNKWAEIVGFRAPDVVGKIAPEIKQGKYSYKDKEKYPGLKELMLSDLYDRIRPGGPPHVGSIPEFEIVPTRQYYFGLPISEATIANAGKTKLDEDGYIKWETWEGGYPFPRPSGEFKAQQISYNFEKRYTDWGHNFYIMGWNHGYTKDLKMDLEAKYDVSNIRLSGRCVMPPFGWFDSRAKERGEFRSFVMGFLAPRDIAGFAQQGLYYLDPLTMDQNMMYIASLRRIRKLSATDTQDPIMGSDQIYDDNSGFMQKLSPIRYPYKYEVLEEREYLYPAFTWDGEEYITSEGLEFRNMKFERRPVYVVKMTQLDPSYVYGFRIFYYDQETFNFLCIENYDQKGRLYRTMNMTNGFVPEMGALIFGGGPILARDHIDFHSTVQQSYDLPAFWTRADVSLRGLVIRAK